MAPARRTTVAVVDEHKEIVLKFPIEVCHWHQGVGLIGPPFRQRRLSAGTFAQCAFDMLWRRTVGQESHPDDLGMRPPRLAAANRQPDLGNF
jgi:hypothetical protein